MNLRLITLVLGVVGLVASLDVLAGSSGEQDQVLTSYYSNGQAKETARFEAGIRDGECRRWYRDGTLRAEGLFEDGKMVGDWTWLSPAGERDLARSGRYLAGRRVSD